MLVFKLSNLIFLFIYLFFSSWSQEPSVYNVTMDVVVEIFIVSTMGPAKKPVTEEDSDVRASQVIQDRTAIKECKVITEEW